MARSQASEELKLQAMLAEYQFVTGLIPYYRSVETTVLSTMAVILAALAGFIGSLNSPSNDAKPNHLLEGNIVALVSWLIVLFMAIEVTALLRILRASMYLREKLYPKLSNLLGESLLEFETIKSLDLIGSRSATGLHKRVSDFQRRSLISSNTILWGMGFVALSLAVFGNAISGQLGSFQIAGYVGASVALVVMTIGLRLAPSVERHDKKTKRQQK